jgi:hypothetical protein
MGPDASDIQTQTVPLSRIKLFHHPDEISLVSLAIDSPNEISLFLGTKPALEKTALRAWQNRNGVVGTKQS